MKRLTQYQHGSRAEAPEGKRRRGSVGALARMLPNWFR